MLVLTVLQGPDKGKRFELPDNEPQQIGRSAESLVMSDHTISRRHAELTPDQGDWLIRDLESSNGTFVNGMRLKSARKLKPGDQIRTGNTVVVFGESHGDPLRDMVRIAGKGEIDVSLEHTVATNEDSLIMAVPAPDEAAKFQLSVLYELISVTGTTTSRNELLEKVMDVIFTHFSADRGFMLLAAHQNDKAIPVVVRHSDQVAEAETKRAITVSKTIVRYVLSKQVGVLSSNAMSDQRFSAGDSVRAFGIRSAMCVPMRFKDRLFGVIQIDSQVANYTYTEDQLALLTAIGLQTGLALANIEAVENRVDTERLAAIGQTVAALSHSIKNIVQGMRGGAEVVELGLRKNNINVIRGGWDIVARNQQRVSELVLNMLSYSKQRKPDLHEEDLNELLREVVELVQKNFDQENKTLVVALDPECPKIPLEASGLHQSVLNLLSNALYAVAADTGQVTLKTEYDVLGEEVAITVQDNGEGISESVKSTLFQPFRSTKGYQGTGLGLAVTKKIVQEHGGSIHVSSKRGEGTIFKIELPGRVDQVPQSSDTHFDFEGFSPEDLDD